MNLSSIYNTALNNSPEKTAYTCGDVKVKYRELDEKKQYYVHQLSALGIMPGDRVALCMHNIPQLPQLYLAVFHLGAIAVPISPYSIAQDLRYALIHSGSRLLLTGRDIYDIALEAVAEGTQVERLICVDEPDSSADGFPALPDGLSLNIECVEADPAAPAMILFTSGSTASPKGIVHTGKSLFTIAVNRCKALKMGKDEIYFNSGYLCHGAASTMTLFPVLYSGGTAIFMEKFDTELFWPMVKKSRPTIVALGPSQLFMILEHPMRLSADTGSFRYVTTGGDTVSEQLHLLFRETMGFSLSESIGMTECGTYMTTLPHEPHKIGSMGKPIIGAEVRLVDEEGRQVKTGDVGQITVRSDTVMSGYWQDEENTARTIVNGWLHTGDSAYQDEDGYYYFAGRIKNMLVRDMCNISPLELEEAVRQHSMVKDCGVVGIPDPRHGQKIIAFVMSSDPENTPDEQDLRDFTATLIMQPRLPDRFFNIDQIPLTPLGKVNRKKLEKIALKLLSRTENNTK